MSPEQARRNRIPVDHRTDIYSLGVTMYEAICGRPPFRGKDHADTLSQIIERDPVEPRKVNPRVPKDLETIVLKCLRKNSADRYRTAEALGQDLRRFVRGDAVEAKPRSQLESLLVRLLRHRIRLCLGASLVCLLSIAVWFSVERVREARVRKLSDYHGLVSGAVFDLEIAQRRSTGEATRPGRGPRDSHGIGLEDAIGDLEAAGRLFPGRPDAAYHQARGFVFLRREEEALETLERLERRHPTFIPGLVLRAEVLAGSGETEAAHELQERARNLAMAEWERNWLRARDAWREGRPEDAAEAYRSLAELHTNRDEPFIGFSLAARLACGRALLRANRPTEALREFIELQRISPKSLVAGLCEGEAWHRLGFKDQARRVLEQVLAASPHKDGIALGIALMHLLDLGEEEESIFWCKKIEAENVRERAMCQVLFHLGRMGEAEEAGKKAVALKPDDRNVVLWLGRCLKHQRKLPDACKVLENGVQEMPEEPVLHQELAAVYRWQERFHDAIKAARRATEIDPGYALAHSILASSLFQAGKFDEAFESHRTATELSRVYWASHNSVGIDFLKLKRFDEAIAAFDRAIEIEPSMRAPHANRLKALELSGKFDAAKKACRDMASLYPPGGPRPHLTLGRITTARLDAMVKQGSPVNQERRGHNCPLGPEGGTKTNERLPNTRFQL